MGNLCSGGANQQMAMVHEPKNGKITANGNMPLSPKELMKSSYTKLELNNKDDQD